jgi:hypothetical protein
MDTEYQWTTDWSQDPYLRIHKKEKKKSLIMRKESAIFHSSYWMCNNRRVIYLRSVVCFLSNSDDVIGIVNTSLSKLDITKICKQKENINFIQIFRFNQWQYPTKIRFLLSLYLFFFVDTLTSNNILFGVTSGFIFSTDQSAMSLLNL